MAIALAAKEIVYSISLLKELGHYNQAKTPLYSDNTGAISIANNPVFHERTKHIATKFHFIRYLINNGIIELIYIPTKEQKADGLTKPLARIKFKEYINYISLKQIEN